MFLSLNIESITVLRRLLKTVMLLSLASVTMASSFSQEQAQQQELQQDFELVSEEEFAGDINENENENEDESTDNEEATGLSQTAQASQLFLEAQMAEMSDDYESAVNAYSEAIALDDDNILYRISKASILRTLKQYTASRDTLIEALPLLAHTKALDLPVFVYNELGELERSLANFEAAIGWYEKSLGVALTMEPSPDQILAPLYNNLGLTNLRLAHYAQSNHYLERALALTEIPLEQYDVFQWQLPGWMTTQLNISAMQVELGLFDEAIETVGKVLQRYDQLLKPPVTANRYLAIKTTALQNRAEILQKLGQFEEAQQTAQQALSQIKQTSGEMSSAYALELSKFAAQFRKLGQLQRAEEYYQKALELLDVLNLSEGADYAEIRRSYADLLSATGKNDEAAISYLQAVAGYQAVFGPEHPAIARAYRNYAGLLLDEGNKEEALEHYVHALSIFSAKLGETHPETMQLANEYANLIGQDNTSE